MRFFLCAFGDFSLGVPVYAVSSLITVPWEVTQVIDRDRDENTYFSLPHFFKSEDKVIRHGFILKPQIQKVPLLGDGLENTALTADPALGKAGFTERRNVLLVTAVEREEDIPQEEIHSLPAVLGVGNIYTFFSGINFYRSIMNVFIDPAVLIPSMLLAGGSREPEVPESVLTETNRASDREEKTGD
ncbi:hypothetical protein TREPR_1660 [Treponema primitia ZAS-2]|uniref:Uncharacterized protein n=1 Tax=Treponema primitia (strain ATCC BAA-887 / DSM 12427 / ZAS-2) TaxID=545694 RepID=F5YNN4_TREPZ|nr:hypothetical protein [Treponema primitia]AEF86633.1 hypothetical protein TREPR_1660 [Treponema primitia ZAS-2]